MTQHTRSKTSQDVLVIYPGRFQPFHKGHKSVYTKLITKYGRDRVFITTSGKVDTVKSPFNFADKLQFMQLAGVDRDCIVETTQPYRAIELVGKYPAQHTKLIVAVSQKDMEEDPRFASWTKKDGSPAYFQPMPAKSGQMDTLDQHAYILTVPTTSFKVQGKLMTSASEVRKQFAQADLHTRQAIVEDLFGYVDDNVLQIMQTKLES